jgi:hypothetical protein
MTASTTTTPTGILAEHITAVNAFDEDAIVATFADDAFVNDAHREFWGSEAIRRWVAKEMVGDKVTIQPPPRADPHQLLHGARRQDRQPDRDPEHTCVLTAAAQRRAGV